MICFPDAERERSSLFIASGVVGLWLHCSGIGIRFWNMANPVWRHR